MNCQNPKAITFACFGFGRLHWESMLALPTLHCLGRPGRMLDYSWSLVARVAWRQIERPHFELLMTNRGFQVPKDEYYAATEAPNGELGFYIVTDGSDIAYRARSLNIIAAELDR